MQPVIVALVILIAGLVSANIFLDNKLTKYTSSSEISAEIIYPTLEPSMKPTIEPTITKKVEIKKETNYTFKIPTQDPDSIIKCNINANCGGGSQQMKKSQCDKTICCQIEGKWYFYLSRDKCLADQQSWVDFYKAREKYTSEQFNLQVQQIIKNIHDSNQAIVDEFKSNSDKIVNEAENYKPNYPTYTSIESELDKQRQDSIQLIEPSTKPKCPATYYTGEWNYGGGELPCEP